MTTSAQNLLEKRQILICQCAALEAKGDTLRLKTAINEALDEGVTVNELKETFSHLYAYTGFPRSLNALNLLASTLEKRRLSGKIDSEGKAWKRPEVWDNAEKALAEGTAIQTKLTGGKPFNYDFCPQNDYYLKAHLFGDIFANDILSHADRELVTVAALSSMAGTEAQLAAHKAGAVSLGNTPEQVDALCRWLTDNALTAADNSDEAQNGAWTKGIVNPYNQFFSGKSYLSDLRPDNLSAEESSLAAYHNVTFEPACRNNWHIHHGCRQVLICVSGKGWYQEWGKEAIALTPGMIIEIPEDIKHWHGAQRDSWFQHLATMIVTDAEHQSNEWLEPVSDDDYNSRP